MSHTVVSFINGVPGSGKDEFIKILNTLYPNSIKMISAIRCVEDLLGIPSSDKSLEARRVKAQVGEILEDYNHFKSNSIVQYVRNNAVSYDKNLHDLVDQRPTLIFVHVRDSVVMQRVQEKLQNDDVKFIRLLMHRPDVMKSIDDYSNDADREALNLSRQFLRFDYLTYADGIMLSRMNGTEYIMLDNSRSLDKLSETAARFMTVLPRILEGF
jgi:ABC-type polar amino acid transport system ATPase subunit